MNASLHEGTTLGHYRITGKIGSGGMGEVYKAYDSRLDRSVALKILPPHLVAQESRLRRFIQEAKSASGLSHPHIVTIHEIGSALSKDGDGSPAAETHYIAMELVDGETLTQKIYAHHYDLRSIVKYLSQAADGLAKAHSAGIVHRDLKPDNIMVTRDGYAKVLDFGLAKLTERALPSGATNAPTAVQPETAEGVLLGTVGYMSPEQAQGKPADHRSDIFSFGCILYEAVARRRPFAADSSIDTLHKIVHGEPESVSDLNPSAPAELRRMIRRCLAKDPERRYQSMKDVSIELRDLAEEFDQLHPGSGSSDDRRLVPETTSARPRNRLPLALALAALTIALGIAGWLLSRKTAAPAVTGSGFPEMKLTPVTAHGRAVDVAISPDGRYVVYCMESGGKLSVFLRQTATGSEVQIQPPSDTILTNYFTFSADGNYLFSVSREKGSNIGKLNVVPTLGGTPRHLIDDVDTPVTISPDGKQLAFVRAYPAKRESVVVIAPVDGSSERILAVKNHPDFFSTRGTSPSWSPDGRVIAVSSGSWTDGLHHNISLITLDGQSKELLPRRWFQFADIAWLPDGSAIAARGQDVESGFDQLWLISVPDGQARRITNDLNRYAAVSVTADGKSLASVQQDRRLVMTVTSLDDLSKSKAITDASERYPIDEFDVGPDGTIWFGTIASGNVDVWKLTPAGERKQITTNPQADFRPVVSNDGRTVFFQTERSGSPQLWSMTPEGGNQKFLADLGDDLTKIGISPDDRWLVYSAGTTMSILPAAGGTPRKIADLRAISPHFSPDGRSVGGLFRVEAEPVPFRLAVMPAEGGPVRVLSAPPFALGQPVIRWMPDGSGLAYVNRIDGVSNIWMQPIDGSAPRQVTRFESDEISDFDFSNDGKQLYVTRGSVRGDVVLITNFR